MYAVSNRFKEVARENSKTITAKIVVYGDTEQDDIVITGNDIVSFSLINNASVDGTLIGNTIAKDFECQIYNNNAFDLENKEIEVYTGLLVDGVMEYVPWGNFIIDEIQNDKAKNIIKIKAMDLMIMFNTPFQDNHEYPVTNEEEIETQDDVYTLYQFLEDLCSYVGVELGTTDMPNKNFPILEQPAFQNFTCRQVLGSIAEIAGCYATIGRDNKVYIKLVQDTDIQYSRNELMSLTKNNMYGAINEVTLGMKDVIGENVTRNDPEEIAEFGEHAIVINDNLFVDSVEKRNLAIEDLWTSLHGFHYYPIEAQVNHYMYCDIGDKVSIQNAKTDDYFDTYILNQTIKVPGISQSTISSPALTEIQVEYPFTPDDVVEGINAEFRVNKLEGEISAVVTEQVGMQKDIAQFKIDSNQIILQVGSNKEELDKTIQESNEKLQNEINGLGDRLTSAETSITEGATQIKTTTGTFDNEGLHIEKDGEEMSSTLDWNGMIVKRDDTEMLSVRPEGVNAENMTVRHFWNINPFRAEKTHAMTDSTKDGIGFFYTGGED